MLIPAQLKCQAHLVFVPNLTLNVCVRTCLHQKLAKMGKQLTFASLMVISLPANGTCQGTFKALHGISILKYLIEKFIKGGNSPAILEVAGVNGLQIAKVKERCEVLLVTGKLLQGNLSTQPKVGCTALLTISVCFAGLPPGRRCPMRSCEHLSGVRVKTRGTLHVQIMEYDWGTFQCW